MYADKTKMRVMDVISILKSAFAAFVLYFKQTHTQRGKERERRRKRKKNYFGIWSEAVEKVFRRISTH